MLDAGFALIGALVFAMILWSSWPNMTDAWVTAEFFGVQGVFTIPTFPFRAITVIGSAIALLACVYRAVKPVRVSAEAAA